MYFILLDLHFRRYVMNALDMYLGNSPFESQRDYPKSCSKLIVVVPQGEFRNRNKIFLMNS